MIYTPANASRAAIYDHTGMLRHVMCVDTGRATVERAFHPHCTDDGYVVATYWEQYRTILTIFGGEPWPQLFICYV